MITRIKGLSFRNIQKEIPIGEELSIIDDPSGLVTKQPHNDENAKALFMGNVFIGYIPKELNNNKIKKCTVSSVWYKENKSGQQPVGSEYIEGCFVAGVEVNLEGDFQITTVEGRTYENEEGSFESITSFLSRAMPMDSDPLMRWALDKYSSYNDYKEGLNGYAEKGTEMHEKIELYLEAKQKGEHNLIKGTFDNLPNNVQSFFLKLGDFEVVSIESRCYDKNLGLGGTCDAVLRINGKLVAFDWKSSKKPNLKHKVQVSFYGGCNDCDYACVVCFGAENKQGYSVSKVDIENGGIYLTLLVEADRISKNLTLKK